MCRRPLEILRNVVHRLHEAPEEPLPPVFGRPSASVHLEHSRVTAVHRRVAIRAAKHLSPVEGQVLYMRWIEAMGEGMADLRFLQAALVIDSKNPSASRAAVASTLLASRWENDDRPIPLGSLVPEQITK